MSAPTFQSAIHNVRVFQGYTLQAFKRETAPYIAMDLPPFIDEADTFSSKTRYNPPSIEKWFQESVPRDFLAHPAVFSPTFAGISRKRWLSRNSSHRSQVRLPLAGIVSTILRWRARRDDGEHSGS